MNIILDVIILNTLVLASKVEDLLLNIIDRFKIFWYKYQVMHCNREILNRYDLCLLRYKLNDYLIRNEIGCLCTLITLSKNGLVVNWNTPAYSEFVSWGCYVKEWHLMYQIFVKGQKSLEDELCSKIALAMGYKKDIVSEEPEFYAVDF
jgi:hypothetical protein